MCGRFTLTASAQAVHNLFPLFENVQDLEPRYNVAPTQAVLAVRTGAEGKQELVSLRWGLVPGWADDPAMGNRLINARAETVADKPAFRSAFKQRRCLILADGFYEWQKQDGHKQPFYFRLRDEGLFAFAGLWERWERGGTPIESCTVLTTEANDLVRPLHERMPVILPRGAYERWLDTAVKAGPGLHELLRPFPSAEMRAYPVTTHVNNPRNDDPRCVVPMPQTAEP